MKGRQIDYFLADPAILEGQKARKLIIEISDHYVLRLELPVRKGLRPEPERRLKKGACWMNPGWYTLSEWKELLREVWKDQGAPHCDWWNGVQSNVDDTFQPGPVDASE